MKSNDMETSHSIELEVQINDKKANLLTSIAKILDDFILLTPITLDGKIVGFPSHCSVNLIYPEANYIYRWKNVTIKAVRYENQLFHCVKLSGVAEVTNRRNAYRVYIGEEMLISASTATGQKNHKVLIRDISETGMSFISTEEFSIGKTVRLYINMGGGREISLRSQILRTQDNQNHIGAIYGCKFTEQNTILSSYLMRYQQKKQQHKLERKRA